MKEKLKLYLENNFEKNENSGWKTNSVFAKLLSDEASTDYECFDELEEEMSYVPRSKVTLPSYIEENKENSFQTLLFELIDDRNLKDSDVYNKVNLDRRLFSKIRSDNEYHPSKETVLLLGLALELSESEMDKLLESASYSLAKNNYFDLIMRFCFINHIYNVIEVNDFLEDYNCKLLNY